MDESAQRDDSIALLQQQLKQMKQQMDASSTALQALEDGSQGHVSQSETRLESLQEELEHVQLEKAAADEAAQQAVQKLAEVCLSGFGAHVMCPLCNRTSQTFAGCSMNGASSSVFRLFSKARLKVQ